MTKTVRKKRNAAEIAMRVLMEVGIQSPAIQTQQHDNQSPLRFCEREGLTLGQLESPRWGVSPSVAKNATRESHPELFEDFIDSTSAAQMLGHRNGPSIRKLMLQGGVDDATYHQLVTQFGIQGFAGSAQNHHVGQCHHRLTCEVFT